MNFICRNKKNYHSYEHRKLILETVSYVDEVIPEKDIKDRDIDINRECWEGKIDFLKDHCKVVYLPRTEGISTTKIKKEIANL